MKLCGITWLSPRDMPDGARCDPVFCRGIWRGLNAPPPVRFRHRPAHRNDPCRHAFRPEAHDGAPYPDRLSMRPRFIALLGTVVAAGVYIVESSRLRGIEGRQAELRGRHARTPMEMTRLGWYDVLSRSWSETLDDRLFSVAAGVAF